jgi:3-methylcrotonyl-CoA carboxylase alpha subunit
MAAPVQVAGDPHSPWGTADGWRMNIPPLRMVLLRLGTREIAVRIDADGLTWDGVTRVARCSAGRVTCDGLARSIGVVAALPAVTVLEDGVAHAFTVVDPLAPPEAEAAGAGHVMSPIPGRVVAVLVAPGDAVTKGQKLVMLEAMKMELSLTAAADGVVAEVRCAVGDRVEEGVELVRLT